MRALSATLICLVVIFARFENGRAAITKGPYIQASAPDRISVLWETTNRASGMVHFGLGARLDQSARAELREMKGISMTSRTNVTNIFYLYKAELRNLRAGARYSYRVSIDESQTPIRRFSAFNPRARTAKFVAYGDSRSFPAVHAALVERYRRHAPDFILHTGDLVARGKDYALWSREFFRPAAGVIDHIPFFSVIGNHEEDGTNYLAYFDLPGKELWYSFDAGPVHVLALDYHFESTTSKQFDFARRDLMNTRAPWKIVFLHYPVFNIGGHASGWGHTNYLPLFRQAKVDLVIAGHSHLYERFRPVVPNGDRSQWPITCITTGGGGASLHTSFDHPALLARETTNHYIFFEVIRDKLTAEAVRVDGSVMDRFSLKKSEGHYPPAYLAQAVSEESLKLVAAVSPTLSTRTLSLPQSNVFSEVTIAIVAPKRFRDAAELTFSLAADSNAYYELEGGPLPAAVPHEGNTNRITARVRATGVAPIRERSGELSPALVFQAHVKTADHQTVVYTPKVRLSRRPTMVKSP